MKTLIVPDKTDPEREAVALAWQAKLGPVVRLGRFWDPPASLLDETCVVYGNSVFCEVLAQKLELKLISPADDLLTRLPPDLLGRRVRTALLSSAAHFEYPCFVKPAVPKLFAASVVDASTQLLELTEGLEETTQLLISEVVEFLAEARGFLLEGQVLDFALYEGEGPPPEQTFPQLAALEDLPSAVVADLGLLGGRWVTIEFNPAWGAGLNGCRADRVVPCIEAATLSRRR